MKAEKIKVVNRLMKIMGNIRIKGYAIIAFGVAGALQSSVEAAPVSPETAREEAASFIKRNSATFSKGKRVATTADLTLCYTSTSSEGNCYYIFNFPADGGFAIISADDRLPMVLGFSESGNFDERRMPDNMKWWLTEYTRDISDFLRRDPNIDSLPSRVAPMRKAVDRVEIAPLLKTTWDQTVPYNNDCPLDSRTGQRSVTGCVATAMAQVMKYHSWPVNPKGSANGVMFNGTTLDWDNMLDSYTDYNWTGPQAAAVAQLMRQCGASVAMQYSSYASGAYPFNVPEALIEYFDYNPSMEILFRDYYTQKEWNDMVYGELEANRPVYYSGQSDNGGHAFVCDGYLGNDLFHFNWGWSGYQDGYFRLNALNPSTGGTGSYAGGYNQEQSIIIGCRKAAGETKRQQLLISTGSFEYDADNIYVIRGGADYNLVYNPLAYPQTFTFGLKVVNVNIGGDPVYFKANNEQTLSSLYGFTQVSLSVGTLPDGEYRIYPAMQNIYGEWQDILVPYGMQRYVTLRVSKGVRTFTNEGPGAETVSHLITADPVYVSPIYEGDALSFRITMNNVGEGDAYGHMLVGLYSEEDLGEIREISSLVSVPGMSSADIEFADNNPLGKGTYDYYLLDLNYNIIKGPVKMEILERKTPLPAPEGELLISGISPSYLEDGEESGVTITALNSSESDIPSMLKVRLLKAGDLSEVETISTSQPFVFPGNEEVTARFVPRRFNLPAGDYYLVCEDDKGKVLSHLHPLKVYGKEMETEKGYYRATNVVTNEAQLTAVKTETGAHKFNIDEYVEGYRVTSIRPDIFAFDREVQAVTLPSGVSYIPSGSFYWSNSLEYLKMNRKEVTGLGEEVFNPDLEKKVVISGADGGYTNIFHNSPIWEEFRMSNWTLDVDDDIVITGGLLRDSDNEIFNPYYLGADEALVIDFESEEGYTVVCDYEIDGKRGRKVGEKSVILPGLYGLSGAATLKRVSLSEVGNVADEEIRGDLYGIDGVILGTSLTETEVRKMPKGVYIFNGRKIVVR
ncbi:MAG: C10 family peptidase [Muribaculaceae bacterium]|nr:C10 family peptidase [Muribaculaceae bacterium]